VFTARYGLGLYTQFKLNLAFKDSISSTVKVQFTLTFHQTITVTSIRV